MAHELLLAVDGLTVSFPAGNGAWRDVVEGVSIALGPGERVGLVGSSGSGKSVTALACLGLVQPPGRRTAGRITVAGVDLDRATPEDLRRLRGGTAGLVFQEPASSLNPVYTVGFQLEETIRVHLDVDRTDARREARRLLEGVALRDADRIAGSYPHQLSGGQLQRVLIALALAGRPRLLIADEPTSALDLLTQAEILGLLARLTADTGIALLLISHDLAIVEEAVERVAVMHAGRVVEEAPTPDLFRQPLHPYTRELLTAAGLRRVSGEAPRKLTSSHGCRYAPRCPLARACCTTAEPPLLAAGPGRRVRCPVTLEEGSPARGPSGA